jgi:hypothetical protein
VECAEAGFDCGDADGCAEHDDLVIAVALACWRAGRKEKQKNVWGLSGCFKMPRPSDEVTNVAASAGSGERALQSNELRVSRVESDTPAGITRNSADV